MIWLRLIQPPYNDDLLRHPLYRLDAHRVRWAWPPPKFRRSSLRVVLIVHIAVLIIWLVMLHVSIGDREYFAGEYANFNINIFFLIALVTIAAGALLDFICLQAALKTVSGEIMAGRWDLLRLTALHERGIVRAKHAGARLRVWRATMILVSMRAASIGISLLMLLVGPYIYLDENIVVESLLQTFRDDPLSTVLALAFLALTALVYALEPFWRMQAMTAVGMALSAYVQNMPLAMLAGVGAIFVMWLLQVVILIALGLGLGAGLAPVFTALILADFPYLPFHLFLLISCIVTGITIYGFYTLLQTWSLRRTIARITKFN